MLEIVNVHYVIHDPNPSFGLFRKLVDFLGGEVAHQNACWCGTSRCSSWHQILLIRNMCYVRYHIALWGNCSIGQL